MNSQASQQPKRAWLAVMGAVLAVDGGSRKHVGADIDAGVSDASDERSAIGPQAINLSDAHQS